MLGPKNRLDRDRDPNHVRTRTVTKRTPDVRAWGVGRGASRRGWRCRDGVGFLVQEPRPGRDPGPEVSGPLPTTQKDGP